MEKYSTGLQVAVGYHKVEIVKYLAEGGFAQIYAVKFVELLNEFNTNTHNPHLKPGDLACLKRVIVKDERGLQEMRNEVEVMKLLSNKPNVVQYYDSNATRNHHSVGGFEVLLLMELCPNESLLTYLNQRLATKLAEQEILKIMYDISIGISQLHYLEPALIHRDIKIENVLVDLENNFKLCDFGSTTKCSPVATTYQDIAILGQDIYQHTTPQYRSPEMIDLFRYLPINEKSDIWALGVFLYKLLFYTTPFEHTGQFAILHAKYDIPKCKYSPQLINLIVIMLCENPYMRPNIYQVVYGICSILNVDVPIPDKYGIGPYDFDNFVRYQKKSQILQQQLFAQATNVNVDNSFANSKIVNDPFLDYFDVMPRIQETKSNLELPTQLSMTQAKSITSEEKSSRNNNLTVDSNKSTTVDASTPTTSNEGQNMSENITIDKAYSDPEFNQNENKINIQTHNSNNNNNTYPNETYNFTASSQNPFGETEISLTTNSNIDVAAIPKMQANGASHHSPGKHAHAINIEDTSIENTLLKVQEKRINYSKQHKSNNPFPNIVTEEYSAGGIQSNNGSANSDNPTTSANAFTKVSNNIFNIQQTAQRGNNQMAHNAPINFSQQPSVSLLPTNNVETIQIPDFTDQPASFSKPTNQGNILDNKGSSIGTLPTNIPTITNNNNNNIDSQYNQTIKKPQTTKSTQIPFPPPIVTQYSHKLESPRITPYTNHQSSFFMDSHINAPTKSIQVTSPSLPLNRENNVKSSSNPFPYTQNIVTNRSSPRINENVQPTKSNIGSTLIDTSSSDSSLSETPSKLQTNTVSQTKENLIDILPVVKESSGLSINGKDEKNQSHKNVTSHIDNSKPSNKDSRPLQFSLDEIDLSQESSFISGVLDNPINIGATESANEDNSIASSESINLNLVDRDNKQMDNSKKVSEKLKINNDRGIQRGKSMRVNSSNSNLLRTDRGEFSVDSKRHRYSLDLELQEINFSTQSLNLSFNGPLNKNKSKNNNSQITVSSSPQSTNNSSSVIRRTHHHTNHFSKAHHQQLSSIATHDILNREDRTKNRSKLTSVRQSLDIERLRKDSLLGNSTGSSNSLSNGVNSKRRSFFSLFKNDKN